MYPGLQNEKATYKYETEIRICRGSVMKLEVVRLY